jgi:acyl-CoA synthetase (AMP-forming)/AMP-acid ligase II
MPGVEQLRIGDVFTNAARAVPERTAAVAGRRSLTFAGLDAAANRLVRELDAGGIGRGSRVVLWTRTDLDAVPVFAALAKLGALLVPVNGLLEHDEVGGIIGRCRADLVITDSERALPAGASDTVSMAELLERSAGHDPGAPDVEGPTGTDPHVAFFTSGSTGAPKGAVLSHAVDHLRTHPGALPEPRGAMVCPYPLFHMGAWTIALQQWQARDCVVLLGSADAGEICEAVARHRAWRLNCVPAVWQRIIDHVGSSRDTPLATVRFADTGTSATGVELLGAIGRIVPGAHLRVFYGSTEAGSVACLDHADIGRKPGSCGPPAPGVTVRVDEDGELWVTSPVLFDGYLDDPVATAAALVDGWYRTGDLVEEDDDGFLSVVGRTGELIRTGGEAVAPAEVEAVLHGHPAVAEVAVVGVPEPVWGEVVCAVVVAAPSGPPPTLEALRAACEGRLAPFKHPRRLELVDALPRTASTGQVRRRALVESLARS